MKDVCVAVGGLSVLGGVTVYAIHSGVVDNVGFGAFVMAAGVIVGHYFGVRARKGRK